MPLSSALIQRNYEPGKSNSWLERKKGNNPARAYFAEGRLEEAESLYLRALALQEKTLIPAHPDKAATLYNNAELLRKTHRKGEARKLANRTKTPLLKRTLFYGELEGVFEKNVNFLRRGRGHTTY